MGVMALSWLHKFVSAKSDGVDSTLVKPSNWNAEHDVKTTLDGILLGRPAGAGPGDIIELLMTEVMNAILPAGLCAPFAGSVAPAGWYLCDAAIKDRAAEPRLFTAIGTNFNQGGETAAQFRMPDFRGRAPVGLDLGAGVLPGWVMATRGGASTSSTGSFSMGALNNFNFGNLPFVLQDGRINGNSVGGLQFGGGGVASQLNDPLYVQGYTTVNGNFNVAVSGGSAPFNVVQPSIAVNYIIKA
jgi:microcystin-dependent protein